MKFPLHLFALTFLLLVAVSFSSEVPVHEEIEGDAVKRRIFCVFGSNICNVECTALGFKRGGVCNKGFCNCHTT
ncbi:PREDICTED: uncharacterized protein LOC108558784 [Nicrophorus vespilloides]|uniref:Uncharacterized protein LOC108558784 n=1 Tax=Nicrophorus vespilloides TaxID=110193 RepID=A0ABM1M9Q4_NICVS|nr:PREDICTED: uncharacterized protein LOC108558784 [Nicrophorus vespilloides]